MTNDCEHEFTNEQNAVIERLVRVMTRTGLALVAMGVVFAAYQVLHYFEPEAAVDESAASYITAVHLADYLLWVLLGLNGVLVGGLVVRARRGFKLVITTEGRDIEHLLSALASLTTIFALTFWVLLISTIVLFASTALLVVFY
jgi:hypothetical protein